MEETLYKYRSLQNFENFLDILLCNRLYGAHYDKLNDPMECSFHDMNFTPELIKSLRYERRKLLICSLSKNMNNNLLWSHYADGHRGVCIKLKVRKTDLWQRKEVSYVESMPNIPTSTQTKDILPKLFGIKAQFWSYEEEVRYVKSAEKSQSPYLPITPVAVYLGYQISSKHKTLIKHIINLLNEKRKEPIELIQMKNDNMNFFL